MWQHLDSDPDLDSDSESDSASHLLPCLLAKFPHSRYGSRGFWGEVKSSLLQPDVHLTFMFIYIYMYP